MPDTPPSSSTARGLWLTGLLLVAITGTAYWHTLHPGVGPYLDSIEYQLTTLTLGISHPPGHPLYTWLGALFVHGLPFGNPAFRLHLFSAVAAILTVLLTQRIIHRLTRSLPTATLGALFLAFAVRFWYQASYAELYPLYNAFVAANLLALLTWMETRAPRYYYLSVALYAFSFGVHVPALVLLPMWLWVVLTTDHRMLTRPRSLALTASIVLLAAAQYLYIPLRALGATPPAFCNFCPQTWAEVPDFITGKHWWGIAFGLLPQYWLQRWADSGYQLMLQFWPGGVMAGGVGLWTLLKRQPRTGVAFTLGLAGTWFLAATHAVVDWDDFMTPVYVIFAPLIAVGLHTGWQELRQRLDAWRPALLPAARAGSILLCGLWLLLVMRNNYPLVDQSRKTEWHGWARDLLPLLEEDAWVLTPPLATDGFIHTWVLRYISWAENLRPELTLIYLADESYAPPGPPPGYLTWREAAPRLHEQPVYLVELNDPRVSNYALHPLRRYDGWIIGYRVVGEYTDAGFTPWVDAETWAALQDDLITPEAQP